MKKIVSLLITCTLVLGAFTLPASAANGDFSGNDVTAFTISGNESMTASTRTESDELARQLRLMLSDSVSVSAVPQGAVELAQIIVEKGFFSVQQYKAYSANNQIYLASGLNTHSVSREDFFALLADMPGFYRYASIPSVQFSGGLAVPPKESSYIFKRLDGLYYSPALPKANNVPALKPTGETLPLPTISPAAADVTVDISQGEDALLLDAGTLEEAKVFELTAGSYRVKLTAAFNNATYRGTVVYIYDVVFTDPVEFAVKGASTTPGEIVVLQAANVPAGQKITVWSDIDFSVSFFSDGKGGQLALLPVSYFVAPGEHYVELSALGTTQKFGITARDKSFQVQQLTVGSATTAATIASQEANTEFNNTILPLRWTNDDVQHWSGRFILPVSGAKITTQFGAIRYTNGSSEASRHGGVDLSCPTGTTISASNAGRVLYAGNLKLTGRTILLEHGYGLKTWYYHMDKLAVNTGDMVIQGQKIGEVGSTGYSTGPHLHFAMSVNNVFVNPYTAIDSDLLILE